MVTPTITLEASLGNEIKDVAGRTINDVAGNPILDMGMTSILSDTRIRPKLKVSQGIGGIGPLDRVADPGEISFLLDNVNNQYSPDHASARDRFANGIQVKFGISSAGNTDYIRGRIGFISPDTFVYGRRGTEIIAYDWMKQAVKEHVAQLAIQTNVDDDSLLTTLVDAMDLQPLTRSFTDGPEDYAFAFHGLQDEKAYVLGVMDAICRSGLSFIYLQGDATYGETLVYMGRDSREDLANDPPSITLNDSMKGLKVLYDEDQRVRKVTIHVVPTIVDVAATTVIYSIVEEISIAAGESETFVAKYRDPNDVSTRISATDQVAPVADTDYKMSSVSGNDGNDQNANLAISVTFGGNSAIVTLTNNGGATGYVNKFQFRGKGIYRYDKISKSVTDSTQTFGKELDFTLPYSGTIDAADAFAQLLLDQWKEVTPSISGVEFVANRNADLMEAAITGKVGDLINIVNAQSGVDQNYFIQHRSMEIDYLGAEVIVRWLLINASTAALFESWILDSATRSQLDSTTILGL